ncbi:hypothetical protein AAC387_Pa09g1338 [Persea americana]
MEWQKWAHWEVSIAAILTPYFHTFTIALLSLTFPLSFLLLARLSLAQHLLTFTLGPPPSPSLFSLFTSTSPPLIHSLVFILTATALVHVLRGHILQPGLRIAWASLCALHLCVESGIEATTVAGLRPVSIVEVTSLRRGLFFVGLYETMVVGSRVIVRPIVDDTIYGVKKEETSAERVAMGAAFGALWWWRLRFEVEVLGATVEVKERIVVGCYIV